MPLPHLGSHSNETTATRRFWASYTQRRPETLLQGLVLTISLHCCCQKLPLTPSTHQAGHLPHSGCIGSVTTIRPEVHATRHAHGAVERAVLEVFFQPTDLERGGQRWLRKTAQVAK